jgi:nucleoside-diphosphate-sugar epimerase
MSQRYRMTDNLQDDAQTRTAYVAGATGYTGQAVVKALRARGLRVHAHVRPDSPRLAVWRARFAALGAQVDTTPWDAEAMRSTLAATQPDAVFALLGTTRSRSRRARAQGASDSYETVDYGLTATLLRATESAAPRARFVYLSSVGVGPGARGAYVLARWKVEQELAASGIDYIIVRPSIITGSDRDEKRLLERVAAVVGNVLLAAAGARVREKYRSRTAAELAEAIVAHALQPDRQRRVLEGETLFRWRAQQ